MDNYTVIKNAIINKQQVKANYKGHYREMCPHAIGSKNGKRQALFYQFGGFTSNGAIIPNSTQNWKCMLVDELEILELVEGSWHSAGNHSRSNSCIDILDVEVEY